MVDIEKKEIWKNVTVHPYEDKYKISSFGRILSLHSKNHKILKPCLRTEYMGISLHNNGHQKTESIHRLVALTFLENKDENSIVNHKDGNKLNNSLENLEWTTIKKNNQHALENNLRTVKKIRVSQYSLKGDLIKVFNSIKEAMKETGVSDSKICTVAKQKRKTAGGFVWKYTDFEYNKTPIPEGKSLDAFPNYIITNDGQVYSKSHEQYMSLKENSGYQYVKLYNEKLKKDFSVHYLVAKIYIENPENLPMINHKDCQRNNNKVANLEWVTYSENMKHKVNKRQEFEEENKSNIKS